MMLKPWEEGESPNNMCEFPNTTKGQVLSIQHRRGATQAKFGMNKAINGAQFENNVVINACV